MPALSPIDYLKLFVARALCIPAILAPYRVRIFYVGILAFLMHAPFKIFGRISRFLCEKLQLEDASAADLAMPPETLRPRHVERVSSPAAVLFSGGTDSTCAAYLACEKHAEVHLLTFFEHATRKSPEPLENVQLLKNRFGETRIIYRHLSTDELVRYLSYERYLHNLLRHRLLALATCGFSSLSWHARTIEYCLENGIRHVSDGLTRELMHFPGHMDAVVAQFRELYAEFGISYENTVRNWPTPPDQQLIDKVLVNRHGGDFILGDAAIGQRKTTGKFLFDHGLFPSPNMKGSRRDFTMQHDCYPFALYNIIAFWGYLPAEPYAVFSARLADLMREKIEIVRSRLSRPAGVARAR